MFEHVEVLLTMIQKFNILVINSSVYNYFDDPRKLFLRLHLAKFVDTLAKLLFSYHERNPQDSK